MKSPEGLWQVNSPLRFRAAPGRPSRRGGMSLAVGETYGNNGATNSSLPTPKGSTFDPFRVGRNFSGRFRRFHLRLMIGSPSGTKRMHFTPQTVATDNRPERPIATILNPAKLCSWPCASARPIPQMTRKRCRAGEEQDSPRRGRAAARPGASAQSKDARDGQNVKQKDGKNHIVEQFVVTARKGQDRRPYRLHHQRQRRGVILAIELPTGQKTIRPSPWRNTRARPP